MAYVLHEVERDALSDIGEAPSHLIGRMAERAIDGLRETGLIVEDIGGAAPPAREDLSEALPHSPSRPDPGRPFRWTAAGRSSGGRCRHRGKTPRPRAAAGRVVALGRQGDPSDPNGHGTPVAGSLAGDGTASNGAIRGIAPGASLFVPSLLDARGGLGR